MLVVNRSLCPSLYTVPPDARPVGGAHGRVREAGGRDEEGVRTERGELL